MENERKATIYDFARLCHKQDGCRDCPLLHKKNGDPCSCAVLMQGYTDEANEIILKWCDEHPVKTYADDFFEKFPDAKRNAYGVPYVCPKRIYPQFEECPEFESCTECWKMEFRNEGES